MGTRRDVSLAEQQASVDDHGAGAGSHGHHRHSAQHSTRNRAKDAARQDGKTAPEEHNGHFHATDENGEKVNNGTHHEYRK